MRSLVSIVFVSAVAAGCSGSNQNEPGSRSGNSGSGGSSGSSATGGTEAGGSGTGGSTTGGSATGGTGGTAAPMLPDGPSGTLPGVSCTLGAKGVFQEITPPEYDETYRAADFVVDENTGVVFLGTDSFESPSKGILRTANCGQSWEHVSTGQGEGAVNGGRQWTFRIDPDDGRILYTNSGYFHLGLWKSFNGGVDWYDITTKADGSQGFTGNLQMDPDDPDHLLTTWHGICNGKNNEFEYEDNVGCFHESTDGGITWRGHYGTPKWPAEVRVLVLHGQTWMVLADNLLRTTDGGATYTTLPMGGLGGHSSGTLSYAKNGDFYLGTAGGIYRSSAASDGAEWTAVGGASWVGEVADNGTSLFVTQLLNGILTSPSNDGVNWTPVEGSPMGCERAKVDPVNKVVYFSCAANGFWRYAYD